MADSKDRAAFKKGDNVVYTSNTGSADVAVVLKVHYEDDPPFYTIYFADRDVEKQTDEKNLTYLPLYDDGEEEDDDDDDDDDLSPPQTQTQTTPAPQKGRRASSSSACITKPTQPGVLSWQWGVAGIAVAGVLFLAFTRKKMFLRR